MKKRKWCYIMNPTAYEMSCDLCGGTNITWSEYERMIWCYDCKKDTHGKDGIFGGPIGLEVCKLLGISFDRIDIKTGERLFMNRKGNKFVYEKAAKQGDSACQAEESKEITN